MTVTRKGDKHGFLDANCSKEIRTHLILQIHSSSLD